MQKLNEKHEKHTQFGLRLSPGEAVQLDAIARHLGISKSDVLRLSLASQTSLKTVKPERDNEVVSEALDAVSSRIRALSGQMESMESLLGSAIDLLLSLSRNAQPDQPQERQQARQPDPQNHVINAQEKQTQALPSWAAYCKKNYKSNPVMSDSQWSDFLRKRYEDEFKQPPDLST